MNKGINYIAGEWKNIEYEEDPFSLAIVTYALHASLHQPLLSGSSRWP